MKNYFNVEEGKEVNSLQELYLTYTTIMINLIDTDSYEDMMIRVCKDILENKNIIEDIEKLPRKKRLFLGPIIYNWAQKEWGNHSQLPQSKIQNGYTFLGSLKIATSFTLHNPFNDFVDNFEKAFHKEVLDEANYRFHAESLYGDYTFKNGKYNITMSDSPNSYRYKEVMGRMIVKYKEKENILHVSYIENIEWSSNRKDAPQYYRTEMFKSVRTIMNQILEEKGEEPKITCNKKYLNIFNDAKKRGYLVYKSKNI